ncbi:hypothetical protein SAMN05443999_101223 [Roseovarius azorensis]|uniref:Uncharacterized protein n=1 Tax=Roseovarius azorensis TaxID=1287727 RepID=A0A1H7G479_9RHOB|nr:hypothetical protein [Roseovarius azorensis]SEK32931.1 hypothetical protein SAMN05443999_101223 [Roseovarius azorensis]
MTRPTQERRVPHGFAIVLVLALSLILWAVFAVHVITGVLSAGAGEPNSPLSPVQPFPEFEDEEQS